MADNENTEPKEFVTKQNDCFPNGRPKYEEYWANRIKNKYTGNPLPSNFDWINKSKLSPKRLAIMDRDLHALRMRKEGYTYQEIADALGYSTKAHVRTQLLTVYDKTIQKHADDYREEICNRYERLMMAFEEKALEGDKESSKEYREIMQDLRKLLALDIPVNKTSTKVNINSKDICKLAFPNSTPIAVKATVEETAAGDDA